MPVCVKLRLPCERVELKVQIVSLFAAMKVYGRVEVWLHSFLILALWGRVVRFMPGCFIRGGGGEILQYSLNGRLSGPENWSGRCGEEISVVAPTKYQTMIPQTVLNDFLHQGQDMEF